MSRSHTNVDVPRSYCREFEKRLEHEKLKLELALYKERAEWAIRELQNVAEAVKEWGYVSIRLEETKETVVLVEKKEG